MYMERWPIPPKDGTSPSGDGWLKQMYTVYILSSLKTKRYYIGHTDSIERRLREHNSGKSTYTKSYIPWEVIYTEEYPTKQAAYAREMQIKSYKGGRAFRALIQ